MPNEKRLINLCIGSKIFGQNKPDTLFGKALKVG